jgi:hypothetical protein
MMLHQALHDALSRVALTLRIIQVGQQQRQKFENGGLF